MAFRIDEKATDLAVIDRHESGFGWIAHPDERMQRASHALEREGSVWLFDPVDAEGLDDYLAEFGSVRGVVVCLDRHKRDAAAIANRHDATVYLHDRFDGVAEEIDAPVVRFGAELGATGLETIVLRTSRFWQEIAVYDPTEGTLYVPESVGAAPYFLAGSERLGVHPMLRLTPPRSKLGGVDPERVLVGHGRGVLENAATELERALARSRRGAPRLYAGTARSLLPL